MDHRVDLPGEEPEPPEGAMVPAKQEGGRVILSAMKVAPVIPEVVVPVNPLDVRDNTTLFFSRYQEDGTLRLYAENSYIGDTPARYSDEKVSVKIMVKRPSETFMVVIGITRRELDLPGAEERLAEIAYRWKN